MTLYIETSNGVFSVWPGTPIDDIRHPINIEQLWSNSELNAIGLYIPAAAATVPPSKVVVSTSVQRVDGVVKYVNVLEDKVEDPSNFVLNRIQFEFIISKLGLVTAIDAAIEAMPESTDEEVNAKIMARVLRQYGQDFERNHPLFTELAPLVGITSEQIDYMWLLAKDI